MREWQRLVGDPDYVEEDLSDVWPVQFGSYIERFALDWHERKTGYAMERRGEVVTHPLMAKVSCTLDAWRALDNCVIDCKAIGQWRKLDDALPYYTAQMVVQRACVGAARAALLVVHGGGEPAEHPVEWTEDYEVAVWTRVAWFLGCVETLTPPVAPKPVAAPVTAVKVVDMAGSNAWAEWAPKWLDNLAAAKVFDSAAKELRGLLDADAKRAFGHGIEAIRNARGAVTLKELKV
jgi:hypothetical protein